MVFSNLYPCDICYDGNTFASVEHAYQYTKAKTYGHDDPADQIRKAKDGKEAQKLAREIREDDAWNLVQVNVMTSLINEKVKSHLEFRNALIESKGYTLAEATSHPFWTSGLGPEMTLCTPPERYPGLNMLGKILMDEREILLSLIAFQQSEEEPKTEEPEGTTTTKHESDKNLSESEKAPSEIRRKSRAISSIHSGQRRSASVGATKPSENFISKEDIKHSFSQPIKRLSTISPDKQQSKEKQKKVE